ncbi:MAG: hypothetical protein AAF927_12135 [Bacteroidota bacterium]
MKQSVQNIILLFGMSMVLLAPILPYVQYALFQERIANFYCENQSRPELNCNGQCFLAEQIKAQFEEDLAQKAAELPPAPVSPDEVEILPLVRTQVQSLSFLQMAKCQFWAFRAAGYSSPALDILLPPPQA